MVSAIIRLKRPSHPSLDRRGHPRVILVQVIDILYGLFLFVKVRKMKKYIESISKLNDVTLSASTDEVDRYSEADIFWAKHKTGFATTRNIRKGDIYQFEFGKNYVPEMSYEHRGLVIGISQKLLYVLPIYSYKPASVKIPPLHITDNPNGNGDFYLLKQSEYSFLRHDSIVKLNDIRTVSIARIKYSHNVSIPPSSDTYKFIERCVFRRYFPSVSFEYDKLKTDYETAVQQSKSDNEQIAALQKQVEDLVNALAALQQKSDGKD